MKRSLLMSAKDLFPTGTCMMESSIRKGVDDMTEAIISKAWQGRDGQTRRYVNNWNALVGLEIVRRGSGTILSASIGGHGISNSAAKRLGAVRVWLDDAAGVHVDHLDGPAEKAITADAIIAAVSAAI